MVSRRSLLAALPATALLSLPIASRADEPTQLQLENYYAFLWLELNKLAAEMGVDAFGAYTIHRNDAFKSIASALKGAPATSRALPTLSALGVV